MSNTVMASSPSFASTPQQFRPRTAPSSSIRMSAAPDHEKADRSSRGKPPLFPFRRLLKSLAISPRSAAIAAAAMVAASPLPALAEMEKAAIFDFNLTLPAIAIEFLLLMVALDKIYFTPLGKFMDDRDAAIRAQLEEVKDTSEEVKQLEEQAAAKMKAVRAEIAAALNQMKKDMTEDLERKLEEGQVRVEAELEEALKNLERQKEETLKNLDSQIIALSEEIVRKVLPSGV